MWIYIWTNEIKDIFVWEWMDSYEAMRWPCPEGYHVPSKDEWNNVRAVLAWFGWSWAQEVTSIVTYLKIPKAWYRSYSSSSKTSEWTTWVYWSTSVSSNYAISINISSSSVSINSNSRRAIWYAIRPFKDEQVIPDSSWTTLYQWTWSTGIFHNSTLWIISISWDWTNWITIADKNLWATTVYNNGDTLSDANCGNFYQWWNNNGFPHSWTVTTSSTQVDTTNYWPWNYYSDSTFITRSASPYDRSSPKNDNLRWWTTWITKKWNVIEVYVGTTKVRPLTN